MVWLTPLPWILWVVVIEFSVKNEAMGLKHDFLNEALFTKFYSRFGKNCLLKINSVYSVYNFPSTCQLSWVEDTLPGKFRFTKNISLAINSNDKYSKNYILYGL